MSVTKSEAVAFIRGALADKRRRWALILLVIGAGLLIMLLGGNGSDGVTSESTAEELIEARLEELCSSIDGVGRCRVMVNCSYEYRGYGKEASVRVQSVAVVCRGGDRAEVKRALTELIVSLYGIGSNRVSISRGSV